MEYGDAAAPHHEEIAVRPQTFYGASKAAGTLLLQHMARSEGLPMVILRPYYVYGNMEPSRRLIPTLIHQLKHDQCIQLTVPGIRHDFVYVDDMLEACLKAALREDISGEIFNIASGLETSNEEILDILASIMGKTPKLRIGGHTKRSWDRKSWLADISAAKSRLDWFPRHDISQGLQRSVEYYERTG